MVKSLVVHVGDPKTGTTAIQEILHSGSYVQAGPSLYYGERLNANALGQRLKEQRVHSNPELVGRWTQHLNCYNESAADIGILSGETLARVKPAHLKQMLHETIDVKAENIKIVIYLRPHVDALCSRYVQNVKTGQFSGDIEQFYFLQNLYVRYAKRVERWLKVFGDNLFVFPYIDECLKNSDVVYDFFSKALGIDDVSFESSTQFNRSPSLRELSAIRYYYIKLYGEQINEIRSFRVHGKPRVKLDELLREEREKHSGENEIKLHKGLWEKIAVELRQDSESLDRILNTNGLYTRELERAGETAIDAPQSLELSAHFDREEERMIRTLLSCVVELSQQLDEQKALLDERHTQTKTRTSLQGTALFQST